MFGLLLWSVVLFIGGRRQWDPLSPLYVTATAALIGFILRIERSSSPGPWYEPFDMADLLFSATLSAGCWFAAYWCGRYSVRARDPITMSEARFHAGFKRD